MDGPRTKLSLDDVENLRSVIVQPCMATIEVRLQALEATGADREQRILQRVDALQHENEALKTRLDSLESDRRKAMIGYSAAAAIVTALVAFFFDKLKSWVLGK